MARTKRFNGTTKGVISTSKGTKPTATVTSRFTLPDSSGTPPQLFILPEKATPDARIVTLQNPRHSNPSRYLVCPESGIYEFTRIAAPSSTPRSWLLESVEAAELTPAPAAAPAAEIEETERAADLPESASGSGAHVVKDADLYVASPLDPLFLALPALLATHTTKSSDRPKRMFLSTDDHFDAMSEPSSHLREILRWPNVRKSLETRMAAVCDTAEAGDETMFRLNEDRLLSEILSKAKRMSENGLPKTMEERFVAKPLEVPFFLQQSQSGSNGTPATCQSQSPPEGSSAATPLTEGAESQSSVSSAEAGGESSASSASTAATSTTAEPSNAAPLAASDKVIQLQRLRVAFDFICSGYVAPSAVDDLKKRLATQATPVSFAPLEDYLDRLTKLRQEALAVRSAADYSQKRMRDEEDDDRAEKKRKKEEEEKKKKAAESRGVRDLKKVDVSGMKKLSAFFKKK